MRIISGIAGGRKLETPRNDDVRPTTDNVKESVFNILQFDIQGRRVLDLFAGTGQLGIECLSREADSVVFVDAAQTSCELVRKNLNLCGLRAPVIHCDAINYLKSGCGKFDLIFIDPPYDSGLYEPVLAAVNAIDILSDGGIIICESRRDRVLPDLSSPYYKNKEYRYGKVKITLYKKDASL